MTVLPGTWMSNTMLVGPSADRSQLRHGVAATIRQLIISGQVRPGELLRLSPLAEEMDISITPVREALLNLAQEGWVIHEPNRGFRVAALRRADVEDTYFVHQLLAGELAGRAAERATPEDIAQLRELNARIAERGGSDADVEQLNYDLHQRIYDIANAPRIDWFIGAAARFVPRQFWATIPGWREFNRTAHGPIIDLIEARDVEKARAAMSDHIQHAGTLLLSWLDSISFWD